MVELSGRGVDVEGPGTERVVSAEDSAFRAFLRGSSHLMLLMEGDGTVRWCSPSVRSVLGYEPEEFVGMNPVALIHPEDLGFVEQLIEWSLANESDGRLDNDDARLAFDVRIRHRNGRYVTLEGLSNNLLATPGIHGRLVVARDVTSRRAMDDALTALAEGMSYAEAMCRLVRFLDLSITGTASALWWEGHEPAWTTEEVPASLLRRDGPWTAELPRDGSYLIIEDLKEALAHGDLDPQLAREAIDAGFAACWCVPVPRHARREPWGPTGTNGDWPGARGTLVVWSKTAGHPLFGHTFMLDRGAAMAHFAMTRHQVERERTAQLERQRRQNEQLAQINELRTDLILTMSHDLRNPLTSISGAAEMLAEEEEYEDADPEDRAAYLEIIGHNTNRLIHMVDDLLLLAKLDAEGLQSRHEPVDLVAVTTAAVSDVRPAAKAKGIRLDLTAADGPSLQGDSDQLRHLVDNLVSNAVKYTPTGGRIQVEVCPTADAWELVVTDDGIGIPAAERELIFGRFSRGSNARAAQIAGSGLGLVIAQAVATSHGGDIRVESHEGRGSRFVVTLRGAEAPSPVG